MKKYKQKTKLAFIFIVICCLISFLVGYQNNYFSNIDFIKNLRSGRKWKRSIPLKVETIKLYLWKNESSRFKEFSYTVIPFLRDGRHNSAQRGNGECKNSRNEYNCNSPTRCKIIIVTHIIDIDDGHHLTNFSYYRQPTTQEIRAYFMNLYYVIQSNLNHPTLKNLVLLCESDVMAEQLHRLEFENSEKLIIQNINNVITMGRQIEHASRCYQGQIVAVSNQDILFGNGWNRLNVKYMKSHKIMYALTRHSSIRQCYATLIKSNCIKDRKHGSYDAFVWYVKEHLKENLFASLLGESKPSTKGMENVVVWIFKKLYYEVSNPCRILKIHHEHCIPIRDSKRGQRINRNGISAKAQIAVKLKD